MTGIVRCVLKGYEDVTYIRKADGKHMNGRRLFFEAENKSSGAVGIWCGQVFSNDPEALKLSLSDEFLVFRDDYSRSVPVRYVPQS